MAELNLFGIFRNLIRNHHHLIQPPLSFTVNMSWLDHLTHEFIGHNLFKIVLTCLLSSVPCAAIIIAYWFGGRIVKITISILLLVLLLSSYIWAIISIIRRCPLPPSRATTPSFDLDGFGDGDIELGEVGLATSGGSVEVTENAIV
jgi:hypothetical protein